MSLADVILLLVAAVIAVYAAQSLKLGAIPGFIIAGLVIGPSGFGWISNSEVIQNLAEIGVVFLLFVIGIELRPKLLLRMRRILFGMGTLQVLITAMLVGAITHFALGVSIRATILIGPALALSSTAFVLQILAEKKLITSTHGRTSVAVLLLQDLAVVPLLALVPLLAMPEMSVSEDIGLALAKSVLILAAVILLGRHLLHPLLHRVALRANPEIFTASAVLLVLGTAYLVELSGLSLAMGAFLAGMLISDSSYRHQLMAEVQPFRGLLLGLFFISMGMSLKLATFLEFPVALILTTGLLIAIKVAVIFLLGRLFGFTSQNSFAVALLLGQSGEFALVLFTIAHQSQLLEDKLFQQLSLIVLISMLVTPALAKLSELFRGLSTSAKTDDAEPEKESPDTAQFVLVGYGRVGHRIGEVLRQARKEFVALDSDAGVVKEEKQKGYPVFYGDACKPGVLSSIGAGNAGVVVITINNPDATEQIVASLRKTYPYIVIYARGHHLAQCRKLRSIGANGVVSENVEASLELARLALHEVGHNEAELRELLAEFRRTYHSQLEDFGDAETDA